MKPREDIKGVYFIYAPNQSKIKIGRSKSILKRYINLRTGFMDNGHLIQIIETDQAVELESHFHQMFIHLRAEREWFYVTEKLARYIKRESYSGIKIKNIYKGSAYSDFKKRNKFQFVNNLKLNMALDKKITTLLKYGLCILSAVSLSRYSHIHYKNNSFWSLVGIPQLSEYLNIYGGFLLGLLMPYLLFVKGDFNDLKTAMWLVVSVVTINILDIVSQYNGRPDFLDGVIRNNEIIFLCVVYSFGKVGLYKILAREIKNTTADLFTN